MTVFNRSLLPLILTCLISFPVLPNEVNIYSARQEALIKPLLDKFSEKTAVKVNLVTGKGDALLTRLINEGENSPADILLTVDAGRLYRAQLANVLKPIDSTSISSLVPDNLKSSDDMWVGLSIRARVIIYSKDRVSAENLNS